MNDTTPCYTLDYLLREIGNFRTLWGDRSAWASGKVERGLKALSLVYLHTQGTADERESATAFFQATMNEYARRDAHFCLRKAMASLS